jgi:DnaJ-domain-containing protein 1
MHQKNKLSIERSIELLQILQQRFEKNMSRHKGLDWDKIKAKLEKNHDKLWSLNQMEETDGEPDVIDYDKQNDEYIFFDCAPESPKARRSICYDVAALESRKENKPKHSAQGMAAEMGIDILNEEQFRALQKLGKFDTKTSSWLNTPKKIRDLGGAIFGDFRFDTVFIYHNGAESYYGARGFRGCLRV